MRDFRGCFIHDHKPIPDRDPITGKFISFVKSMEKPLEKTMENSINGLEEKVDRLLREKKEVKKICCLILLKKQQLMKQTT